MYSSRVSVTVPTKKRARRIAGIGVAAAALGVTRQHLRLVIIGERESVTLLARLENWKRSQPKAKS